jgi:hypothetical protein
MVKLRQVENLLNILHDGKNLVCNKMVAEAGKHGCWLGGKSFPNSSPSGHKYASILKFFENQRAQKTSSSPIRETRERGGPC